MPKQGDGGQAERTQIKFLSENEMEKYKYYLIDASKKPLGRIATRVATLLQGKNQVHYQPNALANNIVIVINAEKIYLTGRKNDSKRYQRYSGYHGGIKTETFSNLKKKNPEKLISHAVEGMLPKNRLKSKLIKNLKITLAENHRYQKEKLIKE